MSWSSKVRINVNAYVIIIWSFTGSKKERERGCKTPIGISMRERGIKKVVHCEGHVKPPIIMNVVHEEKEGKYYHIAPLFLYMYMYNVMYPDTAAVLLLQYYSRTWSTAVPSTWGREVRFCFLPQTV